jgi:hypothetical protein
MQFDQLKRRRELIMMLGGIAASSVACPFAVHAQRGEMGEGHTANDPVVKMKIDRFVSGEMSRQKIPGMAYRAPRRAWEAPPRRQHSPLPAAYESTMGIDHGASSLSYRVAMRLKSFRLLNALSIRQRSL